MSEIHEQARNISERKSNYATDQNQTIDSLFISEARVNALVKDLADALTGSSAAGPFPLRTTLPDASIQSARDRLGKFAASRKDSQHLPGGQSDQMEQAKRDQEERRQQDDLSRHDRLASVRREIGKQ